MPVRCAFGCKTNVYPMHVFPNPEKDPERFRVWVDVLGEHAPSSLTDDQIFKRLKICDKHFIYEHRARFKRLSAIAVPYRNLPAPSIVETEDEITEGGELIESDNVVEDDTVDDPISDEGDGQISAEIDIEPEVNSDDDTTDIPSSATTEIDCIDANDPYIKSLLEDGFLTQSTSVSVTVGDADTPAMAEYYHKRWSLAQKRLVMQNKQLHRMRKKLANYRLSEKRALKVITKNMTQPAKLFLAMQMKRQKNAVFTEEEKSLALSIYRKSPECYKLLTDYFVLPSSKIMQGMNLESRLQVNRRNGRFSIGDTS